MWALNYGSGTLTGTGNHPIHTQNGWKNLSTLTGEDVLITTETPKKVCSIAPAGKQQVYNLSVEEAETYYANGVLVHNCTSMALARFRSGGFISLKSDVRDDNYSSPRKAAYY